MNQILPVVAQAEIETVWPLAARKRIQTNFAERLGDLNGKTIAEVWSWMWGGDIAFAVIRKELTALYPDIRFVSYEEFGNIHGHDENQVVADLPAKLRAHGVDGVILGIANCGSCTPAVLRAHLACERGGFPAVSIVGDPFVAQSIAVAEHLGVKGAAMAIYPGNIEVESKDVFARTVASTLIDPIARGLTSDGIGVTDEDADIAPTDIVFRGSLDEFAEHFEAQQWGDGLPLVPPTIERVEAFMRFTPRAAGEVLGVMLPSNRQATIWSVAVTGVMAGCRPEYMPVLVSAVEVMCDPRFRIEDQGASPAWEMMCIVSGPIADQLDFNHGKGVLSTGHRPNTSIGRFLRLYSRNIAGHRIPPGATDHAAIGQSFIVAMSEDEAAVRELGWPTYGEDMGAAPGENAVTVRGVVAASPNFLYGGAINGDAEAYMEPLKKVFGDAMCGYWGFTGATYGQWHPLVVICPDMARLLAEAGWDKDRLRSYLFENCRVSAAQFERYGECMNLDLAEQVRNGILPATYHESDDPDRLVPVFIRPEWIGIVVTGLPCSFFRGYMGSHEQGIPTMRRPDLPSDWNDLLSDTKGAR